VPLGLVLTALAFARWAPFWSGRRAFYLLDAFHQAYPWQAVVSRVLASAPSGPPLWNPYSFCGSPLLADPQFQVLYPPAIIFRLLPFASAYGVWLAVHTAVAAVGMAAFLSGRGLGAIATLLGAVGYGFGAHPSLLAFNPQTLAAYAWLPWLAVFASAVAVTTGSPRRAGNPPRAGCSANARSGWLALAVVLGWVILAGSPQHVMIAAALAGGILVTDASRDRARVLLRGVVTVALAGAITAAVLVPAYRYIRHGTMRGVPLSAEARKVGEFPLRNLTGYLFPLSVWRREGEAVLLPGHWLDIHCVGTVLAVLVPIGLLIGRRDAIAALALVGVGLTIGLGSHLPAVGEWLRQVPPLSYTRNSAMWLGLSDLGLAWLGAAGLHALSTRIGRRRARLVLAVSVSAVALTVGQLLWVGVRLTPSASTDAVMASTEEERFLGATMANPGAWGRVIHWLPAADPGTTTPEPVWGRDREDLVRNLRAKLMPNLPAVSGCRAADGDNPLVPSGTGILLRDLGHLGFAGPGVCMPMLEALGVKWIVSSYPLAPPARSLSYGRSYVSELPGSRPPAWIIPETAGRIVGIVNKEPGCWEVQALTHSPCVVVVGESRVPGWRLIEPREGAGIVAFNGAFVGVPVRPGSRRVRMRYDPIEARVGMFLSCAVLAAILGGGRRCRA
jgi:hypothetical protein